MSTKSTDQKAASSGNALTRAFARMRNVFLTVGLFSGVINILALTGSFYMLQVYDRVLPSHSVPTLVAMTVLLVGLYLIYGVLDIIRLRVMSRAAGRIEGELSERLYSLVPLIQISSNQSGDAVRPTRDLDQIRSFLSSLGPTALFDLPWMPVFLLVVYLLHPWLGIFATIAALILVAVTISTEFMSTRPARDAFAAASTRMGFAEATRRNAEAVRAMGFQNNLNAHWRRLNEDYGSAQTAAGDIVGGMGSLTRVLRFLAQSGILGLGAYLVIAGEVTAGTIIAASITMSRALAPVETAIAHWRPFVAARESYGRITGLLEKVDERLFEDDAMPLPLPSKELKVTHLTLAPPGAPTPTLVDINFTANAGDAIGVVGNSAAGKSTLAKGLVGIWNPSHPLASVRLDGAELSQYRVQDIGPRIGYMPQEISLFRGSIAANISRMDPDADSEKIVAAARAAGCHEMILELKGGYDKELGDNGTGLSVGQRQRIALARALYGDPFLVVLDEPNANLDNEGNQALVSAIKSVRDRGGIAVIITHRQEALIGINKVLKLENGKQVIFGPIEEVRQRLKQAAEQRHQQPAAATGPAHTTGQSWNTSTRSTTAKQVASGTPGTSAPASNTAPSPANTAPSPDGEARKAAEPSRPPSAPAQEPPAQAHQPDEAMEPAGKDRNTATSEKAATEPSKTDASGPVSDSDSWSLGPPVSSRRKKRRRGNRTKSRSA